MELKIKNWNEKGVEYYSEEELTELEDQQNGKEKETTTTSI